MNATRRSSTPNSWRRHGPLLLLLAARLALGLAYSQIVPIWEADNEDSHFVYARYLAQHHSLTLPPADPEVAQIWERFQPPLYYDLIAPVIGLLDQSPAMPLLEHNPYFVAGDAGANNMLHRAALSPAERATELAVRAGRAVGVFISTLGVLPLFLAAKRLWPHEPAMVWSAAVVYAFWPQFLFIGSVVTNDLLITTWSALAVLMAVELVIDRFQLRRALVLAASVGLGLITKLNGVALIVLAGGALAFSLLPAEGNPGQGRRLRLGLGLAGLAAVLAGAIWILSSLNFVTQQIFRVSVARDFVINLGSGGQKNVALVGAALAYGFRTFLALYGWGNLESFSWLYGLWPPVALLAAAGLGIIFWGGRRSQAPGKPAARVIGLLLAFTIAVLGLAVALAIAQQNVFLVPGRYLLPALPAVALLLVGGWRACLPARGLRRRALQAVSLGLVLVGWLVPFQILAPVYARPGPETAAHLSNPVGAFFGDSLELLGYDGGIGAVAGGSVKAMLCWQAVAPTPDDYTLFLEVVGADGQGYGRLRTYPGHGNYPTSEWLPNRPFCERYTVQVGDGIPAPALAHLRVSWLPGAFGTPLPVRRFSGAGTDDPAYLIDFKVAGRPGYVPAIAQAADYRLGQQIRLTGFDAIQSGSQVKVTLRWQALEDVTGNYVVFTHLRDSPDHAYAQGDSQPIQGAYPTWLWQKGEVILDTHLLELPPGGATPPLALYVGMVDATTQQRLAVFDTGGRQVANDEIVLAQGLTFP